jgi:hypothetical protein
MIEPLLLSGYLGGGHFLLAITTTARAQELKQIRAFTRSIAPRIKILKGGTT